MWYFAWVLGVSFAASFAILNAMWLETVCDIDAGKRRDPEEAGKNCSLGLVLIDRVRTSPWARNP